MPDLAELEIRIKSVEAQVATRRLEELSQASKRAQAGAASLTGGVKTYAETALKGTQHTFGLITSLKSLALVGIAIQATRFFSRGISSIENLRDYAIQLGTTVKEVQQLKFAAEQSGTSIESFAQGLTIASSALEEFQLTGKGPSGGIIRALGDDFVSAAKDASSFIDLLPLLAEKFRELDEGERTLVARKLLGRGGAEFIQFLTSDLDKLRQRFRVLSNELDDETAGAVDNVTDSVNELTVAWNSFKTSIIKTTAGPLTEFFTDLAEAVADPGETLKIAGRNFGTFAKDVGTGVLNMSLQVSGLPASFRLATEETNRWSQETIDLANAMGKAAEERRKLGLPIDFVGPLPLAGNSGLLKRAAELDKAREAEEKAIEGLSKMQDGLADERTILSSLNEDRELSITLLDIERLAKEGDTKATRQLADQVRGGAIALNEYRKGIVALERATEENKQRIAGAVDTLSGSFADFGTDAVFQIKSVEDAFEDLWKSLSSQVLNNALKQAAGTLLNSLLGTSGGGSGTQLGSILGSLFSSEVPAARGNIFRGGNELVQFGRGGFPSGITNTPTYFPMSRGRTGVMSEFGQEEWAIAPLARTPSGKLGVDVRAAREERSAPAQNLVVNQYIKTQDVDSFHRSRRQVAADIKKAAGLLR